MVLCFQLLFFFVNLSFVREFSKEFKCKMQNICIFAEAIASTCRKCGDAGLNSKMQFLNRISKQADKQLSKQANKQAPQAI